MRRSAGLTQAEMARRCPIECGWFHEGRRAPTASDIRAHMRGHTFDDVLRCLTVIKSERDALQGEVDKLREALAEPELFRDPM